ncbi:alanine racemase [Prauserella muralis]|uniref:Alanine racemase n=1 Tax=Prauserella muralis TaxID=588067 RepID=A0A2V4BAR3_9PSEU|nr:alanine racemase [Prauserella muralis]PXY32236.1 alanine racemase [Prauserella muralis]TWE24101.1 alanine racemase [Prauserella muralis]
MTDNHPPRAEIVIDLGAIRHNLGLLAARAAASGAETMAVVKADGYGHGAVPAARAAMSGGATWLGACSLGEALALREAGIDARLFSWLDTPDVDFAPGIAHDVDLSVSSLTELERVADAAGRAGKPARVHLKIDTGLARNGCPAYAWPDLVKRAAAEPGVDVVAVWSHLACADEPGHPSVDRQAERFADAYALARDAGLEPLRHLANSAATLTRPDLHFDLVRPGIAMYGLNPVPQPEPLRPAMTLRSSVVLTKRIEAGESVSYGHTWTAERDTTLALVPAGYADGVPRTLSGRMSVWLDGARRPIAGRVCMDQLVVDCGDHEPELGAEVVLFGSGERGEPTATEWADVIGTIDYEIVTGMYRPRVRRRYVGEDGR